jgi:hypothetical protein
MNFQKITDIKKSIKKTFQKNDLLFYFNFFKDSSNLDGLSNGSGSDSNLKLVRNIFKQKEFK